MSIDEQSNFMDIAVAVSQLIRERNEQIDKMKMLRYNSVSIIADMIEKLREEMTVQQHALNTMIVPSKEVLLAENAVEKLFADSGTLLNNSLNPIQALLSPSSLSSVSFPHSPQSLQSTQSTPISIIELKSGWKGNSSISDRDNSCNNYPVIDGIKDLGSSSLIICSSDNKHNGSIIHNHIINNNNNDNNNDNNNNNNNTNNNNNNNDDYVNGHCYTQALNDHKNEINKEYILNNGLKKNISESSLLSIDIGEVISCIEETNVKTSSSTTIIERQRCEYDDLEFSTFIVCDILDCIQGKIVMTYDSVCGKTVCVGYVVMTDELQAIVMIVCRLTFSLNRSITHSLAHLLTHLFTHSLTHRYTF